MPAQWRAAAAEAGVVGTRPPARGRVSRRAAVRMAGGKRGGGMVGGSGMRI